MKTLLKYLIKDYYKYKIINKVLVNIIYIKKRTL